MQNEPHIAIVIRPDGTVPFDADLDPAHKRTILGHLIEMGHTVQHAEDGSHVLLLTGPHSKAGQEAARAAEAKAAKQPKP